MVEIFRFLKLAETWIYILIFLVGVFFIRKFLIGLDEYRHSLFGMERNNARVKLTSAVGALSVLFLLAISEFVFVSYASTVVPSLALLPTPTLNLNSTATPSSGLPEANLDIPVVTPAFDAGGSQSGGCIPGKIEWAQPSMGAEVSGNVELIGTVNIPDFGFYKYEYSQDNINWNTLQAGTSIVNNGKLGDWDTSILPSGDYLLRLIVTNHQAEAFAPCIVNVKVVPVR